MRVHPGVFAAIAATVVVAACKEQTPIPHTPAILQVVSGSNQIGDVSKALDSALVVQVLDAAKRPVSGVALNWTVSNGGSLSQFATTSDDNGKSSVNWTLGPTVGSQIATVSSSQISGVAVSFVASNGATISGTVSDAGGNPFATFSRSPETRSLAAQAETSIHKVSSTRIVIGFKSTSLGVASAASRDYRLMNVARDATTRIHQTLTRLSKRAAISHAQVSPAMVAARVRVDDMTQIDAVIAALRADSAVAWVERDGFVSIRDGAPRPMSANFLRAFASDAGNPTKLAGATYPTDPMFFEQLWPASMIDLPRAWAITKGSPSVIVASVDMGVRFDHPEIAANLTNDGYDFVSHDSIGSTENLCGGGTFSTIDGDGNGPDADPTDPDDLIFNTSLNCWDHSSLGDHGLWTAGIIGAVGDGVGMTGTNWTVKIRPIRVLGITGDGSDFDVAQGILYAAGLPAVGADSALVQAPSRAQIINASFGGSGVSSTLTTAFAAAAAAGSLIVASAGNSGLDLPVYPAALPNVMAVAAVGMDGALATYSNAGTYISVAAPGGDFRLDDNGGGGILGPGWDFIANQPTYLFGYGTSASAPYVSGIAALLLAQNPTLTATDLRSRIEQFATRPVGASRSNSLGWGIVNAYNALTQQHGPPHATFVRLVNATTGAVVASKSVGSSGAFAFTRVANGAYLAQAGDDESSDSQIGIPGRRFAWAGSFGAPSVINVNNNSPTLAIGLGLPSEVEPNDDVAHANFLTADSWVTGNITTPDVMDVFALTIAAAGTYTIETSGLVGTCGLGIELDTFVSISTQAGQVVGSNDNTSTTTGRFCSHVQATLTPGIYYISVTTSTQASARHTSAVGRYRLQVRTGA